MIDIQRGEDTKLLLFQTLIALIGKICLFFSLPMHKSAKNKAQSTKRCMEIIFLYSISEGPNDFNLWKYLWGILKKSALMRGRKYWNTWRCRKAFFKRNFQISSNIWGRRPPQPHSCTACNPWTHDSNEASTHPSNFNKNHLAPNRALHNNPLAFYWKTLMEPCSRDDICHRRCLCKKSRHKKILAKCENGARDWDDDCWDHGDDGDDDCDWDDDLYNIQQTRPHRIGRRWRQCRWKPSQASTHLLRCRPPFFWNNDGGDSGDAECWWWLQIIQKFARPTIFFIANAIALTISMRIMAIIMNIT